MRMTPKQYLPGIGLRPGGGGPHLEPALVKMYAALYASIAAHSRLGLNVVVDVGHHDAYSRSLGILPSCAQRLLGLPALLVGVRCPLETILARRRATGWMSSDSGDTEVPAPILRWQEQVHIPGIYDLEVDTALLDPPACAVRIKQHLDQGPKPTAIEQLAARAC